MSTLAKDISKEQNGDTIARILDLLAISHET